MTLLSAGLASSAAAFELQSADLSAGGQLAEAQVYAGFGCNGGNLSPELAWTNAPTGTKSFAVTVYDPDASTGSGW
ncbi:MAG: YbhB/YbcL family Raf kinase inhibitor-like protein, partial [Pseudomonas sp.]